MLVLALVLPGLHEIVGHRIVMDRNKQIGRQAIGDDRPLEQPDRRRLVGDEQHGLVEAGTDQRLFDLLRQLQVEGIFRHAAGTERARHIEGVADIDDDAECRGLAVRVRRRGGGRRLLFAPRRTRIAAASRTASVPSKTVPACHGFVMSRAFLASLIAQKPAIAP